MQTTTDAKSAAKRKRAAKTTTIAPQFGLLVEPTTKEELLEAIEKLFQLDENGDSLQP